MSDIEKVKQLREATGAGFKDCSKNRHNGAKYGYSTKNEIIRCSTKKRYCMCK